MNNIHTTASSNNMQNKECTVCNTVKSLDDFYKNKTRTDGHASECKQCASEAEIVRRRSKEGLIKTIYKKQIRSSKERNHKPPSYQKHELIKWCLNQQKFHDLYDDWVNSNYEKDLTPSIDRLDDYKGYSLANVQLSTWRENYIKAHKDRKEGVNNKHNKAVKQLDLEGNLLNTFHSVCEAKRVTGVHTSNITKVCNKITRVKTLSDGSKKEYLIKTAGGFKWEYV